MKRMNAIWLGLLLIASMAAAQAPMKDSTKTKAHMMSTHPVPTEVRYGTETIDGVKVFYREAGPANAPKIVLLHGFPSSSHMYRNLIPALADRYHVIAPDYPGFGFSEALPPDCFEYTFDHLASVVEKLLATKGFDRYSIYIQDYGSPVGFRLATRDPKAVQAIITQNGNAYDEGLSQFWDDSIRPYWAERNPETEKKIRTLLTIDATKLQYSAGVTDPTQVAPEAIALDQALLDRPGNDAIQLALFYDYRKNPPLYPAWHKYLREAKPAVLVVWGKNDPIFIAPGAEAFRRDVPDAEIHMIDSGHFALEDKGAEIASLIRDFLARRVK